MTDPTTCAVPDCTAPASAHGLCRTHERSAKANLKRSGAPKWVSLDSMTSAAVVALAQGRG